MMTRPSSAWRRRSCLAACTESMCAPGCRRAEREAAKARALEDGAPADIVDRGGSPAEAKGDDDGVAIWRMEPEELFSWNGFPDLDLRDVINKIRNRCK